MKRALAWGIPLAASAGGLWWALRGVSVAGAAEAWRSAESPWALAVVPLWVPVEYALRALRWSSLSGLPFRRAYAVTAAGFFLNSVLPARAGEAARLYWTHRGTGRGLTDCAGVLGLDRLFDVISLAVLLAVVAAFWPGFPGGGRAGLAFAAAVAAGTLLLWAAARRPEAAVAASARLGLPERARGWLAGFLRGVAPLADGGRFARLLAVSLLFWGLVAGVFAAGSRAFGLDLSWTEGAGLVLAFCAGAAVPAAPGYVGTMDAAGVSLLAAAGRTGSEAGLFVLVSHALQLLASAAVGAPALLSLGRWRRD